MIENKRAKSLAAVGFVVIFLFAISLDASVKTPAKKNSYTQYAQNEEIIQEDKKTCETRTHNADFAVEAYHLYVRYLKYEIIKSHDGIHMAGSVQVDIDNDSKPETIKIDLKDEYPENIQNIAPDISEWNYGLVSIIKNGKVVYQELFPAAYSNFALMFEDLFNDGKKEFIFTIGYGHGTAVRWEEYIIQKLIDSKLVTIFRIAGSCFIDGPGNWYAREISFNKNDKTGVKDIILSDFYELYNFVETNEMPINECRKYYRFERETYSWDIKNKRYALFKKEVIE